MAAKINVNGSITVEVTSEADIAGALALFGSLVQEGLLIDGREYELRLSYSAWENSGVTEGDVF